MNQRIIYILNILLFVVFFLRTNAVSAFDGEVYVEETAAQLSTIITSNKLLISEGKAGEGIYLFNKLKETYQVDLIGEQERIDVNAKLGSFNGRILTVLHAPYPVGTAGNKEAKTAIDGYSTAIFSKLKTLGQELGVINIWPVISNNGQSMSYQINILQTEGLDQESKAYLTKSKDVFRTAELTLKNIVDGLLERNETAATAKLSFINDGLISSELTPAATANLPVTYLTPSCQYIQFTTAISDQRYRGIYLVAFTYQGKQYNYCNNVITQKEGIKETIVGEQRTSTTSFLPFKTMNELPPAQAIGFKKVICENGDYFVSIADSWYFKNFSIKPCNQVNSFRGGAGTIELTSTTCQTYVDNCNSTNGTGSTGGGQAKIINKTEDPNIDLSSLLPLFNGEKSIASTSTIDPTKKYRTSKVIIFLSDKDTKKIDIDDFEALPTPNGEIKLWLKKDATTSKWTVAKGINENAINNLYTTTFKYGQSFNLNTLLTGETYSLEDLATVTYLLSDWLSKGIGHLYIPEYWWNCDIKEFKPPLFIVVVKNVLQPTSVIVDLIIKKNTNDPVFNSADAEFAGKCGIWDGFIGVLDALPQAASMIAMNFSANPEAQKKADAMSRCIDENGGGVAGFAGMMWNGITSTFDPSKPCVLAHASGQVVFDVVAAIFTGGTAAAGSKAGSAIKIALTALEKLDVIGTVVGIGMKVAFKGTTKVLTISIKNGVKFVEATFAQSAYVLKVFDATQKVMKDLNWSDLALVREVTLVTLDGQQIKVMVLQDPLHAIKNGIYKIEDILKDDAGVPIRNANGDYSATVEIKDPLNPNGPVVKDVVVIRELGSVAKLGEKLNVSDFSTSAKNSIKDGMTPDHIPSFAALKKNLENKLGRQLDDVEAASLRNEGTSLLYETSLHQQFSRTYGGRNSISQIADDAQDLFKAAQKDMDALRKPLKESGMSDADIEKAFELIHEMNRKKGLY